MASILVGDLFSSVAELRRISPYNLNASNVRMGSAIKPTDPDPSQDATECARPRSSFSRRRLVLRPFTAAVDWHPRFGISARFS